MTRLLRHTSALALAALALAPQAHADTTTLTPPNESQLAGLSPAPLVFPVERSGDIAYPLLATWRTQDDTAVAGLDYEAVTNGVLTYAAGGSSANASVTIDPIPSGDALAFKLRLEGAVGTGPAPTFSASQPFDVTGGGMNPLPQDVAAVDVNGDGALDLAIAGFDVGAVKILMNTTAPGAASASFSAPFTFFSETGPRSIAVADLNRDGRPDLVIAGQQADNISVLMNNTATGVATPNLAANQPFAVGFGPIAVATGDINGDGLPDVVVAHASEANVDVLLNTTTPGSLTATFAALAPFPIAGSAVGLVLADVNTDGRLDLALSNFDQSAISVLLNTTTPGAVAATFATHVEFPIGGSPSGIGAVDLDDDGRPELLTGRSGGEGSALVVLRNTTAAGAATPSFAPRVATNLAPAAGTLAFADLNGDGKADVLAGVGGGAQANVLLNRTPFGSTAPHFATPAPAGTASGVASTIAADVNRDGRPDLVTAVVTGSVAVALNTTTPLGLASPVFAAKKDFSTPQNSHALALADFNADGRKDIAVSTGATLATIAVLLNTSQPCVDPTFTTQQTFPVGNSAYSVVAPDLNGDGRPDLVAGNFISGNISALLNTTPAGASVPTFTAQQTFATGNVGNLPQAISAADMNGDGKPDVVAAVFVPGTMVIPPSSIVSVLLNTTAPNATTPTFATFQPFPLGDGVNADGITVLDVNGDGKPDVAVADYNAPGVKVVINATTPGSATMSYAPGAPQSFASAAGANAFVVGNADINSDGRPDLLVTNYSGLDVVPDSVSVLLNTTAAGATTSSFATHLEFGAGNYAFSVAASDLDGDGRPDVVVGNNADSNVSVLLNTTAPGAVTPSLGTQQTFGVGSLPYSVAAADFNGDGKPDVVAANTSSFNSSVLLNRQYLCRFAGNPATGTITHDGLFEDSFEGGP